MSPSVYTSVLHSHWSRASECCYASVSYAIKKQRGASKKPLVGDFGCEELVLYGIRDTGGATI